MRIRMITTAAGPEGVYQAGQVVVVSNEMGQAFVEGGYAEPVKARAETAAISPPESAVKPAAKKRRRGT
jgi:hypothetical protein